MSKRAIRRHHRERIIAKARRIRRRWYNTWEPEQHTWRNGGSHTHQLIDHTIADESARRMADHMKVCSCSGCGNPRRHGGVTEPVLTRQERLAELVFREQLAEIDE